MPPLTTSEAYEQRLAKQLEAHRRSREKQLKKQQEKWADPVYKKAQFDKQNTAKKKQLEKQRATQIAKNNCPEHQEALREKQALAKEKALLKAQARAEAQRNEPRVKLQNTQLAKKSLAKRTASPSKSEKTLSTLNEQECLHDQRKEQKKLEKQALQQAKQRENQLKLQQRAQQKQIEKQRQQLESIKQSDAPFKTSSLSTKHSAGNKLRSSKPASKGLKGRTPTTEEKRLTEKLATIGCICCLNKGWYSEAMQAQEGQTFISMHHVDGRTKPWAHAKQLPLCHFHHQVTPPSDAPKELFPLHGSGKNTWEAVNGTQEDLMKQAYAMINEDRPWLNVDEQELEPPSA